MVNNAVVIPIAILAVLVGLSLIGIWIWFPKTWKKGTNQEMQLMTTSDGGGRAQGETRADKAAWADNILANARARMEAERNGQLPPDTNQQPASNPVQQPPPAYTQV